MILALKRRTLGLAAAGLLFGSLATAQPATIKLLVGFPPGGGTDAIARVLAEKLKDQLGTNVIVENKAGAGGQIAAQALKVAPADGSVLFLSHDHTISILPQVVKNPGFDPANDFVPVAGFASFANGLALSGGTPAKTVNEYVAWVREHSKGKGTVGVPAPASTPDVVVKVIGETDTLELHAVPYRG
ncbi:MAG: Twin-arginine translocation pathway signal, partial [Burkholderiales bacterium]|nr:Twin-arginine translocation pathway signal [Burkholderiales bacterium]